ncbi:unnamed protein product [Sphagnum tenellum]
MVSFESVEQMQHRLGDGGLSLGDGVRQSRKDRLIDCARPMTTPASTLVIKVQEVQPDDHEPVIDDSPYVVFFRGRLRQCIDLSDTLENDSTSYDEDEEEEIGETRDKEEGQPVTTSRASTEDTRSASVNSGNGNSSEEVAGSGGTGLGSTGRACQDVPVLQSQLQ